MSLQNFHDETANIWANIKHQINRFQFFNDKIFGCNICTDDGETFYTLNHTIGDKNSVQVPPNALQIGTYKTYADTDKEYMISVTDLKQLIDNKDRFLFINNGFDVFGLDLRRYRNKIKKIKSLRDIRKIAKKINEKIKESTLPRYSVVEMEIF